MKEALSQYFTELKEDLASLLGAYQEKHYFSKSVPDNASLLEFLPYRHYLPESGIFENKSTMGFVLRVSHFAGINEQAKRVLKGMVAEIPSGCTVQVINYASPRIAELLTYWDHCRKHEEILEKVTHKRVEFFKQGTWKSILGNRKNVQIRDFELYFCFSMSVSGESAKSAALYDLLTLKDKVIHSLKGINCNTVVIDCASLASFIQEIINPSTSLYKNSNTNKQDIQEYFDSLYQVEMHKEKVVFKDGAESFNYLVFEVVEYPEVWQLANSIDYLGQFDSGSSLPCPFYITYGFKLESREKSERVADKYRMIKTKQGDSKLPMFFPKMIEEIEDWRYASRKINSGERLGKDVMYVVLCVKDKENLDTYEQIARDHFARLRFRIERLRYDTINPLLYTLPFGIGESWQIQDQLKISSTRLSDACMNFLPVFADQQNYGSPLMLLVGRRGQLFFFDNYKAAENVNGNFNTVVVGSSGTGKSVFIQEYAASTLRFGGHLVIVDDGRSFERSAKLLGGDFVDFGGGDFCINPFSFYQECDAPENVEEYKEFFEEPFIDLVVSILCIIANVDKNNNNDPEAGLYRTVMSRAVAEVMAKKGSSGGLADIREELIHNKKIQNKQTQHITEKLEYVLQSYSEGRYARFFNGKATLNIGNRLTVFELSDLEHNPTLQNCTLLTVMFLVYTKMRARERRTVFIIDEAWKLLPHPAMGGCIEGTERRSRKYDGCVIVASQRIADFDEGKSQAAAAALSQSDWVVILSVSGDDERMLREKLNMSDAEINIARSLSGLKGAYSEFMIRHKSGSWQIGRLILDPFSAKLYSTTAEDIVVIKRMREQGLSIENAIESLIEGT